MKVNEASMECGKGEGVEKKGYKGIHYTQVQQRQTVVHDFV